MTFLELFLAAITAIGGISLSYWSEPISARYNAWTTKRRERFANIYSNPLGPSTSRLSSKVMLVLLRLFGAFLFVEAMTYIFVAANRMRR
jgi:hypothetical protein